MTCFLGPRLIPAGSDILTDRQQEALDLIAKSVREKGYPPTLREIGKAMGIGSTNGVNDHLRALERKGYLIRSLVEARGMRLTGKNGPGSVAPKCSPLLSRWCETGRCAV